MEMNVNVNFLRHFFFSFFLFLSKHIYSGEKFTIARYTFKLLISLGKINNITEKLHNT